MTVDQPRPVDDKVADLARRCDALKAVLQQLADGGAADEALQGLLTAGSLALLDIKVHRLVSNNDSHNTKLTQHNSPWSRCRWRRQPAGMQMTGAFVLRDI